MKLHENVYEFTFILTYHNNKKLWLFHHHQQQEESARVHKRYGDVISDDLSPNFTIVLLYYYKLSIAVIEKK